MSPRSDDEPFRILCVCTGNICRSPAAERLLAYALGPTVEVASVGTRPLIGHPISPPMDTLMASVGADPGGFAARALTAPLLRSADLVLGLTRDHRRTVVERVPGVVRRTFTLREYARLLDAVAPDALPDAAPGVRARASLPLAAAARRTATADQDDIADPYGQGDAAYAVAFDEIRQAVEQIARVLARADVR